MILTNTVNIIYWIFCSIKNPIRMLLSIILYTIWSCRVILTTKNTILNKLFFFSTYKTTPRDKGQHKYDQD